MSEHTKLYQEIIKKSLIEDHFNNDITSDCCIKDKNINFKLIAKEDIILCAANIAQDTFDIIKKDKKFQDCSFTISKIKKDGDQIKKDQIICMGSGSAKLILAGERVLLNIMQHLSGIATKTNKYITKLNNAKIKISDTRKTIPLLRNLQKYAVKIGGGFNHRKNLSQAILIKDNHIAICGDIATTLKQFKNKIIEIECDNIDQVKQVMPFNPQIIMLDNMNIDNIDKCTKLIRSNCPKTKIEISGGIIIDNIKQYSNLDIDYISIGDLTHSVKACDISLEIC